MDIKQYKSRPNRVGSNITTYSKQQTCNNSANIIKENHKRIRAFQYEGIKKLKKDLSKQRKLHYISFSIHGSNMEKKIACLPIREIERDVLQFNGEQIGNFGFEWKINRNKTYKNGIHLNLTKWIKCQCCNNGLNIIKHKKCIISIFIQSFILGSICMKSNGINKDLGIPQKNEIMKKELLNQESMINLLLRIKYQSISINFIRVTFDLFNRNNINKCGYLTIKPTNNMMMNSNQKLYNKIFQSHDCFVLIKNKSNDKQIFFGVAIYLKKGDEIRIKVSHKTIAMYDVYNDKQEWIIYCSPYCVKHAILSLFQKYIDQQNAI